MPDIDEYTLVNANSDGELVKQVNLMIKRRWRPIGGPLSVLNQDQDFVLIQAMVKQKRVVNPST
jgi:hypothetical protein